jgi:transcriptional regulator with XRE-family HTH domain
MRLNPDGAGLVPGTTDGLSVRLVKPHWADKARTVSRDLGSVGRATSRKWFSVHYLELFCGPGYLLDDVTREEVLGSPLQALAIDARSTSTSSPTSPTSAPAPWSVASPRCAPRASCCRRPPSCRATRTTSRTWSASACSDTMDGMDTTSGIEASFGAVLRRLRGPVSQRELAIRAGTSQSYVSRVEAGDVVPTLGQAEHLANCLGYRFRIEAEPLPRRSDPEALPDQLAMTAEERMQSAANLHNAMEEMKAALR